MVKDISWRYPFILGGSNLIHSCGAIFTLAVQLTFGTKIIQIGPSSRVLFKKYKAQSDEHE